MFLGLNAKVWTKLWRVGYEEVSVETTSCGNKSESWPEKVDSVHVPGSKYVGRVVYLYAYDVAYDMKRQPVGHLLGERVKPLEIHVSRRNPRHAFFYSPQVVYLPPIEWLGPAGPVQLSRTVKIFPIGAISISIHAHFEVDDLQQLVQYHDLQVGVVSLREEIHKLAEDMKTELEKSCIKPVKRLREPEAFTVFCLEPIPKDHLGRMTSAEGWFHVHRREIATLLAGGVETRVLSEKTVKDSTDSYLSYYDYDLAIVDWDAAFIVADRGSFREILYVIELGNVQLAELAAYDQYLDTALERSYHDFEIRRFRARRQVLRELGEIRVDLARFNDKLSNTTRFFGEWYLARLYQNVANRFHLADWQRVIAEKLRTLDGLYQVLKHDRTERWMIILETTIVGLFLLNLALLIRFMIW